MACQNCGATDTIKAHLIPEAFVMEVKADRGEQLLIIHDGQERPKVSNTGNYDPNLLCATCDGTLGRWEGYAFTLFKRLRGINADVGSFVSMGPVDGDQILRFAAGIAWKFAATQTHFGKIEIGPYSSLLREVAFGNAPIPSSLDVAVIRLVELDGDVYYYREPVPAWHGGINSVRFSVGSFVIFLKTDKRPNDRSLPPECWLKGRSEGRFLIAPAEHFTEGQLHRELAIRGPVRRFFGDMHARKQRRSQTK
ncbi:MAG: hypothetical protein WCS20_18095 [Alphaproteobacteria bacterium]